MHLSGIGFLKSMTDEAPRYKMALKHNTLVHLYLKVDFFLKNNLKVYEIALRCQFQSRL